MSLQDELLAGLNKAGLSSISLELAKLAKICVRALSTPQPEHRVLGWPRVIQNEMELECQLVTNGLYTGNATGYKDSRRKELEPGAADWTLLLQIDSDDNTQMMWGDAGMLYVWIRRQGPRLPKLRQGVDHHAMFLTRDLTLSPPTTPP
jgi:hypothetical protein